MLSKPRFSIAFLMIVILLVAIDFAAVRALHDWGGLVLAVLPMINVLILAWPASRKSGGFQHFWMRFEAVGWMMILPFMALVLLDSQLAFAPIVWLIDQEYFPNGSGSALALLIAAITVIYTIPQLLAAWFVAWYTTNHGLTIEHRESKAVES